MSLARHPATWTFLAGVILGSVSDPPSPRPAPLQDGYVVLALDSHVHGFFGDGALPPWELRREAERRGLDAIALTNHNQLVAPLVDRWIGSPGGGGGLLLAGDEVTAPAYHMTAIGVREPVDWRLSAAEAIDAVHAQGGIAIAAHPFGCFAGGYDDGALARLDGVEVAHPAIHAWPGVRAELQAFLARARVQRPTVAAIGASDYHFLAPLGRFRTYVLAHEKSEASVLEAVRAGRTVAYDDEGQATGDPAFVQIVERHRAEAARRRPAENGALRTLAVVCVWTSLLALVLFRVS